MDKKHTPGPRAVMPIMGATLLAEIPFAMLIPHEAQALRNHGQSLVRLAQRGGISTGEAISILEGRKWGAVAECVTNEHYLINRVREWLAASAKATEDETP